MFQGRLPDVRCSRRHPERVWSPLRALPVRDTINIAEGVWDLLVTLARVDAVMEMSWSMQGSSGNAKASETQVTIHVNEGTRESVTHVLSRGSLLSATSTRAGSVSSISAAMTDGTHIKFRCPSMAASVLLARLKALCTPTTSAAELGELLSCPSPGLSKTEGAPGLLAGHR